MSVRRSNTLPLGGVTRPARQRCTVCGRFTKTLIGDRRCEPCAGVLPLEWPTSPAPADGDGLAALCAELGEHDWCQDASQSCACGQPHRFRICGRCLTPDESDCPAGQVPGGERR